MGGITHPNQYFDLSLKFYQEIHSAEQATAGAPDDAPAPGAAGEAGGSAPIVEA
jgi:hypothetical protein